jgi:hypothetical protein
MRVHYRRSRSGVSPIIATMMLCVIVLAVVAVMYPIVSATMNKPTYAASISQANLLKQGSYVLMTANVKNIGSGDLNAYCVIMDEALNEYPCQGESRFLMPGEHAAFVFESKTDGSSFMVGMSYKIRVYDTQRGLLNEVTIFCNGR